MNEALDNSRSRMKRALHFSFCFVAAIGLSYLLKEPGFSDSQVYVLFLVFFAIGLWLTEAIPPFAVSLFIMAFLVFSLGNPNFNDSPQNIDRYVNTFSSSVIWLMLGGFFLVSAMTKTGLDAALFRITLRVSGTNPRTLVIGLMATTMVASMLMSNTATTAMVIASVTPLLNSLGRKSGLTKAVLLGIPIAASTGGMGTIIGSPANAVAAGALENAGIGIDFLTWMMYGAPLAIVLTAISSFVLIKLFVKDTQPIALGFLDNQVSETSIESRMQRTIVIGIIVVTVLLWLTSAWHGISVAAVSAIPIVFLTLTGVLVGKDVQGLPWDALLLVAGGLSMGVALEHTGLLSHYANQAKALSLSEATLVVMLAFVTMFFSNIMSNTATSTMLIPLGMAILVSLKLEIALIIGLASSTALFLPVSTPPNAIAYSTGLLEQKDFRIGGLLIGLLGPALVIFWVLFIS